MATHVRDDISIEELADTCDEITAGLELDEETTHLSSTWAAFTERADELNTEQQKLERRRRRARIGIEVGDGRWDSVEASFGRAVVTATDGKRDRDPYLRFFKTYTPSSAQDQAPEREVELSTAWIQELQRIPKEPLADPWVSKLEGVTTSLSKAIQERSDVAKEQQPINIRKNTLLQEINDALDLLEGDLLKLFPGQPKRVSSFLSPTRPKRASRAKTDDNQPAS
jgi:hypothetical protein